MPRVLLNRLLVSIAVCAALRSYSGEASPSVADPAAAFWTAYVEETGNYDFGIESIRNELARVKKAKHPPECEVQVAELVEDCIARIRDFEKLAAAEFSKSFSVDELRHLRTIFEIAAASESSEIDMGAVSSAKQSELQAAIDSKVVSKLSELAPELSAAINAYSVPLADYVEGGFRERVFEILEPYEPRQAYHGPLRPSESSTVLRFFAPPLPVTQAYLERDGELAETLILDSADPTRRIGDRLTALITHSDGESQTQWIAHIEIVDTKGKKRERASSAKPETVYSETGNAFRFDSGFDALRIDLVGPFGATDHLEDGFTPPVQSERILVRSDLLSLGLDKSTALSLRVLQHVRETEEFEYRPFRLSGRPFSKQAIAKYHDQKGGFSYTEVEERASAASQVAYNEFFQIAARTPSLRAILTKVAKISPLRFAFAGSFTVVQRHVPWRIELRPDLEISGADTVYSDARIISLGKQELVYLRTLLTQPKPPLQTTAGIFGFVAASPANPAERVVMRVLGGQRGPLLQASKEE